MPVYFIFTRKIIGHGGPVKGLTVSKTGLLVSTSFDYSSIVRSVDKMNELVSLMIIWQSAM